MAESASSAELPWHPQLQRRELGNGLKVLALPNQFPKDRFYMYLDVNVGSTCEDEDEQGIAHYLEHVVFLGTERWKTAEEMREVMAGLGMSFGGDTNASTDQKNTVYTMEAPSGDKQVKLVTEILHQMAFRALLEDECIDNERAAILSEKQMRNTIGYRRSCKMMEMMHGHNILPKRLPIGLEEQIKRFTSVDLRKFYSKWYFPANMTIYIAGVFQLDTVMAALENTFGKESRREAALVPPRPDIVHTYARPEGERVRTFLHDLQTQFACTLELIEPLDDYKTEADYERETCDQLAGLCLEDRIDQIRSSSADPPFTSISWDAACDAVFCCKSVSLSVSARPHDWKGAMTVAVTELCKLGQFGISADELALAKSTLLKDMEDDAEQNDTIPSLDWLEDLMDRETLHHVFSDKRQDLALLRRALPRITLDMVNARCRLIAAPIATLLQDDNPCGVMLCGPVDPLAVMHAKSSDHDEEETASEGESGSEIEAVPEHPLSPNRRGGGIAGSMATGRIPSSPKNKTTSLAGGAGTPHKNQAGIGQVGELLAWDGQEVKGWPVTAEAWLNCVEKALRVELSPHDITVPKHLVEPAVLQQKRHTIAPTWLSPLVRGLEGKPATAGGALDGKGKVGATTSKMGAAGSGGKPVRASSRQRAGATTERADAREPPSKRVRTQGGRQAEDGEVSQEALGDGLLDDSLGIRFWRLSNGVRVTYKHTAFEAGQVVIKMVSRGGKMLETAPLSGRHETEPLVAGNTSSEAGAASASPASPGGSGAGASARVGGPGGTSEETTQVRRGRLGELSLALDTLMDSGLGDHSAQDVERFLSLYAVGVDSHVSMESVTISLSVSTADGGLERALEVLHAMLASTRFDPEALQRSKKERLLEHEQRNKSLNGLTWEALMRSATREDARFAHLTPAHIDAITLQEAAEALLASLRPEHLEIVIVGDVEESPRQLADLLMLYLGTLQGGVPYEHPSAAHWREVAALAEHPSRVLPIFDGEDMDKKKASESKGKGKIAKTEAGAGWGGSMRHTTRVTLLDEEARAVVYIMARTCGFYGQTARGGNLTARVRDTRRLHLVRSFHCLSKVLNNRLHDELREKMGLGYSTSFGSVQYTLLDGGMAYVCVTAFPDKIDETVNAALTIMHECATSRPVLQSELVKARDPITASETSVLASNSTWLSYCTDLQSTVVPKQLSDVRGVFPHYSSLSCQDLNEAARLCLSPDCVHIAVGRTTGSDAKS